MDKNKIFDEEEKKFVGWNVHTVMDYQRKITERD